MNDPRVRAVPFQLTRAAGGDGLTLEGYAAVFNQVARIWDPWDGEYDEVFARGAFAKTLKERTPYLMLQHGKHPLVGPLPIGRIDAAAEDAQGLHVRASLHDNWLVQPVRDAIESGSIDGMSIMFEPVKETRDESGDTPLVTRTEAKLLELGPVVFPAYEGTSVGVRSLDDLNDMRRLRIITTATVAATDTVDEVVAPAVDEIATSDEAAPAGTSDVEAGGEDERSSAPTDLTELLARHRARRFAPTQRSVS